MTAIDTCEPQVIRAFQKEGWEIAAKPLMIRLLKRNIYVDVKFRRVGINGVTQELIVTEVKCFSNPKFDLEEFYTAVGQYLLYEQALGLKRDSSPLYLVIPEQAHKRLFQERAIFLTFHQADVKLVVVNIEAEVIVRWIN